MNYWWFFWADLTLLLNSTVAAGCYRYAKIANQWIKGPEHLLLWIPILNVLCLCILADEALKKVRR